MPFPQVNRYQSTNTFAGYDKPQQDFFAALARQQVPALYFTSADLNFLGTRGWLKNLGFSYIEGPEHPDLTFRPLAPALVSHNYLIWKKEQVFSRAAAIVRGRLEEVFGSHD